MVPSVFASRSSLARAARRSAASLYPSAKASSSSLLRYTPAASSLATSSRSASTLSSVASPLHASRRTPALSGPRRLFSTSPHARASIAPSVPLKGEDGFIDLSHIRTLAVIAHVDHGKTTLVDQLLRQSGTIHKLSEADLLAGGAALGAASDQGFVTRAMDHNDLERERGITILSKCTSVNYNGHLINIVDTPGHADFGGEVERVLSMVDGVLLVVDATEGPSTQTRFVLGKALKAGLSPIVVMNKADRASARIAQVDSDIFDLFANLGATDEQMEYPLIYASAKMGWASQTAPPPPSADQESTVTAPANDMIELFDLILSSIPVAKLDRTKPFSMLTTQIDTDPYVGTLYLGRINTGSVEVGCKLVTIDAEGKQIGEGKVTKIFGRVGLDKVEIQKAAAGEIVSIAGMSAGGVNVTIAAEDGDLTPLPSTPLDPPTISMFISPNDSPLAGREGSKLTSSVIKERLYKEAETNVALHVIEDLSGDTADTLEIRGRGVLHLGVLLETLRREGFEFAVSPPTAVLKKQRETNIIFEPIEEVTIDVASEYIGTVIEKMTKRKAEMLSYEEEDGKVKVVMEVPARGLIGYVAGEFKNDVHGQGTLNHIFKAYEPFKGDIGSSRKGALISGFDGEATGYAIAPLQARGQMFISPGDKVYQGMVIGECAKSENLDVNPTKSKQLTNFRSAGADDAIKVSPAKKMTLEESISYCNEDELIELTPKSVRLRKRALAPGDRKRSNQNARQNITWLD